MKNDLNKKDSNFNDLPLFLNEIFCQTKNERVAFFELGKFKKKNISMIWMVSSRATCPYFFFNISKNKKVKIFRLKKCNHKLKNHQMIYGKSSKNINLITKWFLVKVVTFFVCKAREKIKKGSCLSLQDQQLSLNNFFCKVAKKK